MANMKKPSVMKTLTPLKPIAGLKNAHTSNSKFGMGDFTGGAVKNPMASAKLKANKGSKTPPRSLA